MLGVFLLPAFTGLGYERQDLWSPCDGMHVSTDLTSVYSLIRKSFGGIETEHMLTPRGKSPTTGKFLLRGSNPRRCIKQDSEPNTLPTSYSGPLCRFESCLRLESSRFSMWYFLKLIAKGFLQVLPSFTGLMVQSIR